MAFPTDTFTATDLADLIPEIWGNRLNDFFKCEVPLANFFTDRSEELLGGGDVLHTPNLTEMGANAKSNGAAVTLNSPTETDVDLTVDQWYEVSFAIEDRQAMQVKQSYALQERYAKNAAYTIARQLDGAIAALFSGFSQSVGASTTNVADSDIRAAIAILESACVPMTEGDVAFIFHPNTFWRQVQALDKFSLAINSPVQDPVAKKPMGYLYGLPIIVSTQVPFVSGSDGRYNILAHKDAIHWATTRLPVMTYGKGMVGEHNIRVQSSYVPEYLSTVTTADIVYGVVENRDNAGVIILTHATVA
jgi:hypothetical protein